MEILVLVDMQNDFLLPEGKLYIGHDTTDFIKKVEETALGWDRGPIYCVSDIHTEESCEFQQWPKHCIADDWGSDSVHNLYKKLHANKHYLKNGFVSFKLVRDLVYLAITKKTTIHFAGVLASICVQENIATCYNLCKETYNELPTIVVNPNMVDDITPEAKEAAIKRMKEIYNVKIVGQ